MNYGCIFVWFVDICRWDEVSLTSLRTFRLLRYDYCFVALFSISVMVFANHTYYS